jgi:probable F420-dependent oxidoreductase
MSPKYGIFSPVLTLTPGHGAWEADATVADIVAVAQAAERLGYDHITCSEHVALPSVEAARRGMRYYDPLAVFGYLAAVTSKIKLATYVLVLGYNHPMAIVKRYSTLDVMSGGNRLVLGVGVGSLEAEFDLLGVGGVGFKERGVRGDDALRAIRASWGVAEPAYEGPYYSFKGMTVDPRSPRRDVPIWIGGRSERSLRRAVELAEGWSPFGPLDMLKAMIDKAKITPAWGARKGPLEIILRNADIVDPMGKPAETADEIGRTFAAGATKMIFTVGSKSRAHYIEQLEALSKLKV